MDGWMVSISSILYVVRLLCCEFANEILMDDDNAANDVCCVSVCLT